MANEQTTQKKSKKGLIIGIVAGVIVLGGIGSSINKKDSKDSSSTISVSESTAVTKSDAEKKQEEAAKAMQDRVNQQKQEQKKKEEEQKKQQEEQQQKEQAAKAKEDFISSCVEVPYKDLARNPDDYKGKHIKTTIQINQVMAGGLLTESGYRGYEDYDFNWENDNATYLEKEWYISYELADGEPRILDNDVVTFYGEYAGAEKMERALTGTSDYVPNLDAKYHVIVSES